MNSRNTNLSSPDPTPTGSPQDGSVVSRFFVMARHDQPRPRCRPEFDLFAPFAAGIRDEFMTIFEEDIEFGREFSKVPGGCAVLMIESVGLSPDRLFSDLDAVRLHFRAMLPAAMSHAQSGDDPSAATVVKVPDPKQRGGHVNLRVVVLQSQEAAEAYCEEMSEAGEHGETIGRRKLPEDVPTSKSPSRIDQIRSLLDRSDFGEYERASTSLKKLGDLTREEIAARLAGPLNAKLRALAQNTHTHEQRQEIASWVNGELRAQYLAVRDPKTGRPAIVIASKSGKLRNVSRFRFEVRLDDGRRDRTWTGARLPDLELMPDVVRLEPLAGWASRVQRPMAPRKER